MSQIITPFVLNVPESVLQNLRNRLRETRWPEAETVRDWSQGVPLSRAKALIDHWQNHYDWKRCEAMLNGFGQFRTEIDDLGIHFLHVRSPHAQALPLLITHGWPGSIIEFHKIIGPLVDPPAYGGDPADAFHVIAPSLPGYGFSDRPTGTGWNIPRIAKAWITLMARLGYTRYVAQGGDWGSAVTATIATLKPAGLLGIHLNLTMASPKFASQNPTPEEQAALKALTRYQRELSGYSLQQATRPQTLGYGLADSPVAQALWIYEKFYDWTDCNGDPESVLTRDEMLDNIMLYWLPNTGASSARLYWESFAQTEPLPVDLPTGYSAFPAEIFRAPRQWAEHTLRNIVYWNEVDRGGHFAAFEQPELFIAELRACFRLMR